MLVELARFSVYIKYSTKFEFVIEVPIPCILIRCRFFPSFSRDLVNCVHLLYSRKLKRTPSICVFSGTYDRSDDKEISSFARICTAKSLWRHLTWCTYRGNFCLMSYWPSFFTICIYSPKSMTWTVPATQNISVWYDHKRPSNISGHVNPSVWTTYWAWAIMKFLVYKK